MEIKEDERNAKRWQMHVAKLIQQPMNQKYLLMKHNQRIPSQGSLNYTAKMTGRKVYLVHSFSLGPLLEQLVLG